MKKKNVASPRLAGKKAQDEFTKRLTTLVKGLEIVMGENVQLEVEPNVNTINNIINKKDKKQT